MKRALTFRKPTNYENSIIAYGRSLIAAKQRTLFLNSQFSTLNY